jgi:hypothetical protein
VGDGDENGHKRRLASFVSSLRYKEGLGGQ